MASQLVFLKLGGSLITDKNTPHHAKMDVIHRLAAEIAGALTAKPDVQLLLGHGSGSFGHVPAKKYKTREGVSSTEQWQGFAEVWHEARALNTMVMDALRANNLPAMAFPPCAQVITESHKIIKWDTSQIFTSLKKGILPLIYGDVVFDNTLGGTILSTEEQFEYLAPILKPDRILLAGIESGVWMDYPARNELLEKITPHNFSKADPNLAASESPDVTGGMRSKVHSMMTLIQNRYCREVVIFSGAAPGNLYQVLTGNNLGTKIAQD
ncbi:MAG TPA: isopentenyl phosphate kinase [Anaerolineaceae bacterium]|nr:isopentenyl phosphate kinase [Anaerolineaceae bacterium]